MNYNTYVKSKHWKQTKKYFKHVTKKRRCYVCGSNRFLNVHHLHYRTVGYEDGTELMYLCNTHHRKIHFHTGKKEVPDTHEKEQEMRKLLRDWREESFKQTEIVKNLFFND